MTREKKKASFLVGILLVISMVLFWLIDFALKGNANVYFIVSIGVLCLIWAALMSITVALISGTNGLVLIFIQPIILIVVGRLNFGAFAGAVVLAIAIASAQARIKAEITSRIKYQPWLIYTAGSKLILLGLLVIVAGLSAPKVINEVNNNGLQIPEETVALMVSPFEGVFKNMIPGYSSEGSVDDIIEAQLQQQIQELPPGTTLPPGQIDEFRQRLSDQLNQEITPDQPVSAVIANQINEQLHNLTTNNPITATLVILTTIVLLIRFFIPVLAVPTMVIISGISWFLLKIKFTNILQNTETTERIQL